MVLRFQSTSDSKFSFCAESRRVPFDTWNTCEIQENVFGNQFSTFDSSQNHHEGIHHCTISRENQCHKLGTGPLSQEMNIEIGALFQCRHLQEGHGLRVRCSRWKFRRIFMVGRQRQQISELQFDKFLNSQQLFVWKIRFKNQVTTCSDFPWEVDQRSGDGRFIGGIKILTTDCWKECSKF